MGLAVISEEAGGVGGLGNLAGIRGMREALGKGFGAPIFREDLSSSEFLWVCEFRRGCVGLCGVLVRLGQEGEKPYANCDFQRPPPPPSLSRMTVEFLSGFPCLLFFFFLHARNLSRPSLFFLRK